MISSRTHSCGPTCQRWARSPKLGTASLPSAPPAPYRIASHITPLTPSSNHKRNLPPGSKVSFHARRGLAGYKVTCSARTPAITTLNDQGPGDDSEMGREGGAPPSTSGQVGGGPADAAEALTPAAGQHAAKEDIASFLYPALGIFFINPLMTLIDTAFVGTSAVQQAALSPCAVLLDYPLTVLGFLSVATTSILVRLRVPAHAPEYPARVAEALRPLLYTALIGGCALFAAVAVAAQPVLGMMGVSAAVLPHALTYTDVRSYFLPFQLMTMVAQTSFLARRDAVTPLKCAAAAAVLNVAGDYLLCSLLGWGIAGAAYATLASQFMLLGLLGVSLHRQKMLSAELGLSLLSPPTLSQMLPVLTFAGPLSSVKLMRAVGFSIIAVYVTGLGATALAAHQISVSIYVLLVIISEPLAQTMQTMLPKYLPGGASESASEAAVLVRRVMVSAAWSGAVTAVAGCGACVLGAGLFTSDPAVQASMRSIVPGLALVYLTAPAASCIDGIFTSGKDFKYLVFSHTAATVTCAVGLRAASGCGMGLLGGWLAYEVSLLIRLALNAIRLASSRSVFKVERE